MRPAEDSAAIAEIYDLYVRTSAVSFETEPLGESRMRERIEGLVQEGYPYFVYEEDGEVEGYCYAHRWRERAAYGQTAETAVYVRDERHGEGIGEALMRRLVEACREAGFKALVACITEGNEASDKLHLKLGFRQVSKFEQVGFKFGRYWGTVDFELILR